MIDTNSTLGSTVPITPVSGWFEPAVAALALAGIILVIVYGISRVLNNEKMKAWAISELGQFIASGIIIGSLVAIIEGLASLAYAITGQPNIFGFAFAYLINLQQKVGLLSGLIITLSMIFGVLKSISIQVIVGISPLAGLEGIFKVLNDMLGMTFLIGLILEIQKSVLLFAQTTMLQLFLPVGVVLRTLPFTRAVGGFLMALAIGMAVVYPLTFALDQQVLSTQNDLLYQDIQNKVNGISQRSDVSKFDISSPDQMQAFTNKTAGAAYTSDYTDVVDKFRALIADLIVSVIFLPLINLIITLLFIKQLSELLGSEISINLLRKL